jgi:serine/threonine-protein kinase HipA
MANQKHIYVYLDWLELGGLEKLGILQVEQLRGKEVFSFSYNKEWLESGFAMLLDPDLGLYGGPQYLRDNKPIFVCSWIQLQTGGEDCLCNVGKP